MIIGGVCKQFLYDTVAALADADAYVALIGKDADIGPDSMVFSGQGEIKAQGYATGGKKLQNFSCGLDDGIAWAAWDQPSWMNATITADAAVIYLKGRGNRILTVLPFDEQKRSSQGLFRLKFPPPGPKNAVFWLA